MLSVDLLPNGRQYASAQKSHHSSEFMRECRFLKYIHEHTQKLTDTSKDTHKTAYVSKALVLKYWGMWSTPLLPLLPNR